MRTLGIGVDLVEIRRVQRMMERHGMRGLKHLLTESECTYCMSRARSAQHIAGRVASKEAAYKALQGAVEAGRVSWLDIEVHSSREGRPSLVFHGRARKAAEQLGVEEAMISISHSQDTAVAMVILTGSGPE